MIVEFLGVSGVGKTTVAKAYKKKLEKEGKQVVWDTYDLYANNVWFIRNLKKALTVISFAMRNPKWVKAYKVFLKRNITSKNNRLKPLFNAVYLKALLDRARNDEIVHIFDEGAFQYLWGIKLRGKKTVTQKDIGMISKLFGFPDILIVVDARAEIISRRIIQRGEYVRIMDSDNLINTIQVMQNVQNEIVKYLKTLFKIKRIVNN